MDLPTEDHNFLRREGLAYEVFDDGGMLCVKLSAFPLPSGLSALSADILFRLAPMYPDAPPDMWWTFPALTTAQGSTIAATEVREIYQGREWQRWSRHLNPASWLAGVDGIESYVALLRVELQAAAGVIA